jgi:hypothetical protein
MARLQEIVTVNANWVIVKSGLLMLLVENWMCVLIGHDAANMARRADPEIMRKVRHLPDTIWL